MNTLKKDTGGLTILLAGCVNMCLVHKIGVPQNRGEPQRFIVRAYIRGHRERYLWIIGCRIDLGFDKAICVVARSIPIRVLFEAVA
jgi:hypothetical protein